MSRQLRVLAFLFLVCITVVVVSVSAVATPQVGIEAALAQMDDSVEGSIPVRAWSMVDSASWAGGVLLVCFVGLFWPELTSLLRRTT